MNRIDENSSESVNPSSRRTDSVPLSYPAMVPTPPSFAAASRDVKPKSSARVPQPPIPNRSKGRFFIASILLAVFGGFGFLFFDSYVRYAAFGEVVGRKIELAPPWSGVVSTLHVRVGDKVRAGDPVFSIDSVEMRHRMEQIDESLNLERARLGSEIARLKWEAERVEDTQQLVKADFYEKWSELLWEQSVLTDLKQQLARAEQLSSAKAIAIEKLDSLKCKVAGEEKRIEQLSEAVHSLERRLETDRPIDPALKDQIKPTLVHIENLQAELRRVRQLVDQGVVRCPTDGRVTQLIKFSGEYAEGSESVVELFVDGSTEVVMYVPQSRAEQWSVGDQVDVRIEPKRNELACRVTRLAPEMQGAPKAIMRHYAADQVLLPVVLRPIDTELSGDLVLGSQVRLPRANTLSTFQVAKSWLFGPSQVVAAESILNSTDSPSVH